MDVVTILLALLALLLVLGGVVGTIYPLLPGPPLVFLGLWLGAWLGGYEQVGTKTLLVLAAMAIVAQLLDILASALGARRVGASGLAVGGAVLGAVVGIFFGIPGLLLGPLIGAVGGELLARGGAERAANVGVATWVGLLVGVLAKLSLSLAMVALFCLVWVL